MPAVNMKLLGASKIQFKFYFVLFFFFNGTIFNKCGHKFTMLMESKDIVQVLCVHVVLYITLLI